MFLYAPQNATLTITQLAIEPPGNAPMPGYDPLIVNVADIPIGGCGGESTCPTIEFIDEPFAIADGPAGQPPSPAEVAVLPATGAGTAITGGHGLGMIEIALVLALLSAGLVIGGRRAPAGFSRR